MILADCTLVITKNTRNLFMSGMKLSLNHFLITEIILLTYYFRSIYESNLRNSSLFLDFSNWETKIKISKFRVVQSLKKITILMHGKNIKRTKIFFNS